MTDRFLLYIEGGVVCFGLIACLLAFFVTRIIRNLRALDLSLAVARQQAAEEDLIVRMGLLASGAAHELGTPLSSILVILSDWRRMEDFAGKPDLMHDIESMQAEVMRCKSIVSGILQSAGAARGEAPTVTTISKFIAQVTESWRQIHQDIGFSSENLCEADLPIIADPILEKVLFNVLDNAAEVSPQSVRLTAACAADMLTLKITDAGPGFSSDMLENFGKPYQTTKGRAGGGLGLFLVVNVMRKLGGLVTAGNQPEGGAWVRLQLPLASLGMEGGRRG